MGSFLPTGWYSATQSILIIVGVLLAFTGRDKRLQWPAMAMIISLVAARTATALPEHTMPILTIFTAICALFAYQGKTRASYVIAVTYVSRLACYAAYALGLWPLWMMWEASNLLLNVQIAAIFAGALGGGHVVRDWLGMGLRGHRGNRRAVVASQAARDWDEHDD